MLARSPVSNSLNVADLGNVSVSPTPAPTPPLTNADPPRPPLLQVCIGALGRMQRVPRFDPADPDKVVAARVFPVSWSADHRVVDGGTLARFSNTWKAYLENPALMLADAR